MNDKNAKFGIGAIVRHRVYPFRGVVVDVSVVVTIGLEAPLSSLVQ